MLRGRFAKLKISPIFRISFSLVLLTVCVLLMGDVVGVTPGRHTAALEARKRYCETLAVQFALAAQKNDYTTIEQTLKLIVERNDEVLSAALRSTDGTLLVEAGDHQQLWNVAEAQKSTPTHARVPIFKGDAPWGTVEVRFEELTPGGWQGLAENPLLRLVGFVAVAGFFSYLLFMRRTLKHLDPSSVIPQRVRAALDALSEGLVMLDEDEQIVLANAAFCRRTELGLEALMGMKLSKLGWLHPKSGEPADVLPWERAMATSVEHTGTALARRGQEGTRQFVVNGAPILDGDGKLRGVLATFDDVTELEAANERLRATLGALQTSQGEVTRQNRQLKFLAEHDPLTGLLNRRSFFERYHVAYETAHAAGKALAVIMCDIDHFKKFNDEHGHAVGDQVIQKFTEVLKTTLRESDLIGRYGGEEFCIVLPGIDLEQAERTGERLRAAVAEQKHDWGRVTGSFGVSALSLDPENPGVLIDQADQALYAAKQNGRNLVARWDQVTGYD